MPHAEHSVVIKRPVSEVFAYVVDGTMPKEVAALDDLKRVLETAG